MTVSVMRRFKQAVAEIEHVLTSSWKLVLEFVGATEDSSLWWRSVFERKILKGDVGISTRWFHSRKIDVLWELESLVQSLSQDHQGSAETLEDIALAAKRTSSCCKPGTGRDCNVNNYLFTKPTPNFDLHRRKRHENQSKEQTMQNKNTELRCQSSDKVSGLNQGPRDFNQSSTCYSDDTVNADYTFIDSCCKNSMCKKCTAQKLKRRGDLNSPVESINFHRSASCPDIVFGSGYCVTENNIIQPSTSACSLSSCYFPDSNFTCERCLATAAFSGIDIGKQCRKFCNESERIFCCTNKKVNQCSTDEDVSGFIAKDRISFDADLNKLLDHENCLRLLWEDSSSPDIEISNVNDFFRLHENVQATVNRNRSKINSCPPCDGDCDGQISSNETCRSYNMLHGQHESVFSYDSIITSLDPSKSKKDGFVVKMGNENCQENVATTRRTTDIQCWNDNYEDEFSNQINWNAITDLNGDLVSAVDRQTAEWHLGDSNIVGLASPNHEASYMLTSSSSTHSRPRTKSIIKNKCGCLRDCCQRLVIDTPDSKPIPLKKTKKSTDLTNKDIIIETEMSDMCSVKSDVPIESQDQSPYLPIGRYLGLETVKLPEAPKFGAEDDSPQSFLLRLVRTPLNLIMSSAQWIASYWAGNEGETQNLHKTRTTLHGSGTTRKTTNALMATEKQYYLTGFNAYKYYQLLAMTEAKYDILRLQAERNYFMRVYKWKQDTLMDVVRIAKNYYSDPTEMNLARWKFLKKTLPRKHQSFTDVRMAVSKIPDYFPYFTIILSTVQIIMLCVMCRRYGFAPAGVLTVSRVQSDIPTFLGTESIHHLEEPNPWLGPPVSSFIEAGAVLASCMGLSEKLKTMTANKGYKIMAERNRRYFGCCEMQSLFNRAGTTTQLECADMSSGLGKWKMGMLCSDRPSTQNSIAHVIKPCCTGFYGECIMTSHEHCDFILGTFHVECDHCVQVNCLNELCHLAGGYLKYVAADDVPWLPNSNTQWQWWRYLTAVPLVYGIIHFIVLVPIELAMMIPLEMSVGWHRVAILYLSSSITGEMVGRSLEPLVPHVGSTSGVGGIMGVAVIELFQAWNFLRCPKWEAIKLSAFIILMIFMGTFYLISAMSFIAGLVLGMMVCLVIIPYITYGRRLGHFRSRLVMAGFILIIITFGTMKQLLSYLENCQTCLMLECIPYATGVCIAYYQNLRELNG